MMLRPAAGVMSVFLLSYGSAAFAASPATVGNMTPQSVDMLAAPLPPPEHAALEALCDRTMVLLRASPEFAACVSDLSWVAAEPGAHRPAIPPAPNAEARPWRISVSYRERAAREDRACAAFGLAAHSEALDDCASDLEQALFNTDQPQG